jgi:hypothetical protein
MLKNPSNSQLSVFPPPHGPMLDISMIHPHCPTYVAAAPQILGAAVALQHMSEYRAQEGRLHPCHTSVPASVETYGHFGKPVLWYIRTLSDVALARSLAVTQRSFLASVHRELTVASGAGEFTLQDCQFREHQMQPENAYGLSFC